MRFIELVERLHDRKIASRCGRILSEKLAVPLPVGGRVMDVGSGDGSIASLIATPREDVSVSGVDVLVHPTARIKVDCFDGDTSPFAGKAFGAVMMVDVLHHTVDPMNLLGVRIRWLTN